MGPQQESLPLEVLQLPAHEFKIILVFSIIYSSIFKLLTYFFIYSRISMFIRVSTHLFTYLSISSRVQHFYSIPFRIREILQVIRSSFFLPYVDNLRLVLDVDVPKIVVSPNSKIMDLIPSPTMGKPQ